MADCDNAIKNMISNIKNIQDGHDDVWIFSQKPVPRTINVPFRANNQTCSVVLDLVDSALEELPAPGVQSAMHGVNTACVKNRWVSYGGYTYVGRSPSILPCSLFCGCTCVVFEMALVPVIECCMLSKPL